MRQINTCRPCVKKKRKCNRDRPTCSQCAATRTQCVYYEIPVGDTYSGQLDLTETLEPGPVWASLQEKRDWESACYVLGRDKLLMLPWFHVPLAFLDFLARDSPLLSSAVTAYGTFLTSLAPVFPSFKAMQTHYHRESLRKFESDCPALVLACLLNSLTAIGIHEKGNALSCFKKGLDLALRLGLNQETSLLMAQRNKAEWSGIWWSLYSFERVFNYFGFQMIEEHHCQIRLPGHDDALVARHPTRYFGSLSCKRPFIPPLQDTKGGALVLLFKHWGAIQKVVKSKDIYNLDLMVQLSSLSCSLDSWLTTVPLQATTFAKNLQFYDPIPWKWSFGWILHHSCLITIHLHEAKHFYSSNLLDSLPLFTALDYSFKIASLLDPYLSLPGVRQFLSPGLYLLVQKSLQVLALMNHHSKYRGTLAPQIQIHVYVLDTICHHWPGFVSDNRNDYKDLLDPKLTLKSLMETIAKLK